MDNNMFKHMNDITLLEIEVIAFLHVPVWLFRYDHTVITVTC